MHADLQFGGILISPFVAYALGAFAILAALRPLLTRIRLNRYVANPPLAEAGIYVCILALLVVLL
ncbi:DUF1656 domain-containing protein [Methylobacterium gregans]|uniref:DUF1656 domain-containing protein n=1 Tax=Methylobacterium gregans TaxID=374424 RepID=A0AA37M9A9_9HYPH|nr:DUF1656 domain-containing protein [Methylobacterium gregans]MDQ0522864.1 hypothetical protein [Methylobacterium gregans]GJD77161.1 hypothetical protein NBEOAGPD_0364 [Methylobacterium gregans]GLS55759.1 hypothetical protein GCM10007886_39440 [Methylobacterium gregans]